MIDPFAASDALAGFTGCAPIFPLPNVVLFPHVPLPLHIFESRYQAMIEDALNGNRLVAMTLLRPGWEIAGDDDRPAVFETGCLGQITAEDRLPDGRFHLILRGITRVRVIEEVDIETPYRVARLKPFTDFVPPTATISRDHRRLELLDGCRELAGQSDLNELLLSMLDDSVPLGTLCDVLAHALRLSAPAAQQLLDEADVDVRSDLLLDRLRAVNRTRRETGSVTSGFPPAFSVN
jgi:Lon protease-like protein